VYREPFTPQARPEGSAFGTGSRPTWAEVQIAKAQIASQARAVGRTRRRGPFLAAVAGSAVAGLVALLTGTVRR
jgi:hypothetical protein